MAVSLQIHFDLIAPWCYIAKRRIEAVIARLTGEVSVEIDWLPFELNPETPAQGLDRRESRAMRFGNREKADALDLQVAELGRNDGIAFRFDRIDRIPNTLDIHRVVALARRTGVQNALVEGLFQSYFTAGQDLSSRDNLLLVAEEAGLNFQEADDLLASEAGKAEVRAEKARAMKKGVRRIPYLTFDGTTTLAWLGDMEQIASTLRRFGGSVDTILSTSAPPIRQNHGFFRTTCDCDFCRVYCRHVPGRLDVSDLTRLCPEGMDVFAWSEKHLQAMTDTPFPRLVPVRQENGHCHWFVDGHCEVHRNAPYGCAFFDAHMTPEEVQERSSAANRASERDAAERGLYSRVWHHLVAKGLTRQSGDILAVDQEMRRIQTTMEQN